ncbi:YcjF family protein [Rubellimicrobium roseum]|uniref:Kinase n=1 Tax=Rubellimicrobium roseum TaxID=687525 RepID=A0A5C4N7L4_9RHOB|nr:GTPase [Rubellimicrobium roseum]TNC68508.1 kinase [Rubellimicrobium roseum]
MTTAPSDWLRSRRPPPEPQGPLLPVVWLLGRTGSGKSSLVRALTGLSEAEIGNGYAPCTRTARRYDLPAEQPVLRFLDTRGLGEAGYDPAEDLAAAARSSHLVLALARLDDPAQGEVAEALARVVRRDPAIRVIVVHTGPDLVPDPEERARARHATQARFERAAGHGLPFVELDLATPDPDRAEPLRPLLGEALPDVALLLARAAHRGSESARWAANRAVVLGYAGSAGAVDAAPILGAVAVPAIQAAMLAALAGRYGVEWTRPRMIEFATALGGGVALRVGAGFGLRQMAKLVPVLGQTAGAAAAGALSFATTYALGRAAALYLHALGRQEQVSPEALRATFAEALRQGRP